MRRRPQILLHALGLAVLILLLWIWIGQRHILTEANYAMGNLHASLSWGGGKVSLQVNDYGHFPGHSPFIISNPGFFIRSWQIDPQRVNLRSVPLFQMETGAPAMLFSITIAQWFILLIYLAIWPTGYLLWQRRKRRQLTSFTEP